MQGQTEGTTVTIYESCDICGAVLFIEDLNLVIKTGQWICDDHVMVPSKSRELMLCADRGCVSREPVGGASTCGQVCERRVSSESKPSVFTIVPNP